MPVVVSKFQSWCMILKFLFLLPLSHAREMSSNSTRADESSLTTWTLFAASYWCAARHCKKFSNPSSVFTGMPPAVAPPTRVLVGRRCGCMHRCRPRGACKRSRRSWRRPPSCLLRQRHPRRRPTLRRLRSSPWCTPPFLPCDVCFFNLPPRLQQAGQSRVALLLVARTGEDSEQGMRLATEWRRWSDRRCLYLGVCNLSIYSLYILFWIFPNE
jgi:hypothetical protein